MSSEYAQRMKNLIAGLIDRTEGGAEPALKWEGVGDDAFQLSLTRTTLQIESVDKDGAYPFVFVMYDENGRVIESVFRRGGDDDEFDLGRLYDAASRSHRGVDQKLTEVMEELGIPDAPIDPWSTIRKEPPF